MFKNIISARRENSTYAYIKTNANAVSHFCNIYLQKNKNESTYVQLSHINSAVNTIYSVNKAFN